MKRFLCLIPLALFAFSTAQAELGHKFPPLTTDELAKIHAALPDAKVKPAKPRKLLVFFLTEGFVHASIPYCNEAIKEMGEKTGAYTADFSEDMAVFTPEKLKQYDAIVFNNTTGLNFVDMSARQALIDYAHNGGGIVGIHSATDNFPTWEAGQALMGGKFDSHPWVSSDIEAVKVDDPRSPIVSAFHGKGFWINDEIYQMRVPYDRNHVHVLLSLDMSKPQNARDPKRITRTDNDFAISWIKSVDGKGRVFYCSFGHNPSIYWTPQVLQTYLNGIQYALGDLQANATPSGKLSPQPIAALAPETPAPLNPPAATTNTTGDPLADGLKTLAAYQYGQDRTQLVAFDDYIRAQPPEGWAKIETALLTVLNQSATSEPAEDWTLRTLAIIGSDASVPTLQKLTGDSKWSHLAVYALFSIGTSSAKAALVESLRTVNASLQPAIIGAIGRLGVTQAIPALGKILASDDPSRAGAMLAALDALGAIGTPDALLALRNHTVPSTLQTTRQWALIHAAFQVLKTNPSNLSGPKSALMLLTRPGLDSAIRVAATKGMIQADPAGAWTLVSSQLKDSEPKVRLDVAKLTPELPPDAMTSLATALSDFDPAVQIVIVNSFATTQNPSAEPILKQALGSTNSDVHLAAIAGYGTANLATSVAALLPFLDKSPEEKTAASDALERISTPGSGDALKTALASAKGADEAALLAILSARIDRSISAITFAAASDPDSAVDEAAFAATEKIATPADLPALLDLLPKAKTGSESNHLGKALTFVAAKYPDKDKAADLIIASLNGATAENRPTLLTALISIDSPQALDGLQTLLNAPAVDDRKTVIRALSAARSPRTDALLLNVAAKGSDPSEKILALRGFLDSIQAQNLGSGKLLEDYKKAWALAIRQEDKDAILAAIKNLNNHDADQVLKELSVTASTKSASN